MHSYSLMYHDVVESGDFESSGFGGGDAAIYKLDVSQFSDHLRAVSAAVDAQGFERESDPVALLRRSPTRPPTVLLHFDDGGASALRIADMCEEHGWRGWFHITTDRIGDAAFVTEAQLRQLDERGHVIGSHSASHPARLSSLPVAEIEREWSASIGRLSDIVGHPVIVASVPGGYFSREVCLAAENAGVRLLFNSEPVAGYDWIRGCTVLGRYSIKRATTATEAAAIAAGARPPRLRQWAEWNIKKALKKAGGTHWLAVRKRILDRA